MNFDLTENQKMFREMVHDFATQEIVPIAHQMDVESAMPEELIAKMRRRTVAIGTTEQVLGMLQGLQTKLQIDEFSVVTITAEQDFVVDGDVSVTISVDVADVQSDDDFDGVIAAPQTVLIVDSAMGVPDAGVPDAGTPDASTPDAGESHDASTLDASNGDDPDDDGCGCGAGSDGGGTFLLLVGVLFIVARRRRERIAERACR